MTRARISAKAESFTESVIREMNRLAVEAGAVSLAQGFPDFACPPELKDAAARAIHDDINQYATTWGAKGLRDAIAASTVAHFPDWGAIDPDTMVTVTCGATEAMVAGMLALLDPGDEVVIFEPYYENYGPDAILSGAVPRYVTLHEPDWSIDPDELRAAFGPRTRGLVLNSPHNPTGKVFTREELELIASLCVEFDVIAFTDDIYEHIVFEGEHVPLATLPGMADRTVSIHSMSKSYSVTGWRIGWTIARARPHRRHPARPRLPDRRARPRRCRPPPSWRWPSRPPTTRRWCATTAAAATRCCPPCARPASASRTRPARTTS